MSQLKRIKENMAGVRYFHRCNCLPGSDLPTIGECASLAQKYECLTGQGPRQNQTCALGIDSQALSHSNPEPPIFRCVYFNGFEAIYMRHCDFLRCHMW